MNERTLSCYNFLVIILRSMYIRAKAIWSYYHIARNVFMFEYTYWFPGPVDPIACSSYL